MYCDPLEFYTQETSQMLLRKGAARNGRNTHIVRIYFFWLCSIGYWISFVKLKFNDKSINNVEMVISEQWTKHRLFWAWIPMQLHRLYAHEFGSAYRFFIHSLQCKLVLTSVLLGPPFLTKEFSHLGGRGASLVLSMNIVVSQTWIQSCEIGHITDPCFII